MNGLRIGLLNDTSLLIAPSLSPTASLSSFATYQTNDTETCSLLLINDDDLLEDLPSAATAKSNDDAGTTLRPIHNNIGKAMQLLQAFLPHYSPGSPPDPLVALDEYYRKRGIPSIADYFIDHKTKDVKEGYMYYWTSFECPMTGKEYKSSLPTPLWNPNLRNDELRRLATTMFDRFRFTVTTKGEQQQQVVFVSKRGARRAVALSALEGNDLLADIIDHDDDNASEPLLTAIRMKASTDSSVTTDDNNHGKIFLDQSTHSKWVHDLHDMGVTNPSDIKISYREIPTTNSLARPWSPEPTQLCCILTYSTGAGDTVTSISLPFTCKNQALENAILLLGEEIERQKAIAAVDAPTSPTPEKRESKKKKKKKIQSKSNNPANTEEETLRQISKMTNPSVSTYISHLPAWATEPLEGKPQLYLYQLRFVGKNRTDFVSSTTGLEETTPLGILFARPLPMSNPSVTFTLPAAIRSYGRTRRVQMELSGPTEIDMTNSAGEPNNKQLKLVESFNRIIHQWESYGMTNRNSKNNATEEPHHCAWDRSYIFCPLISDTGEGGIDWEMMTRIVEDERTRLVEFFEVGIVNVSVVTDLFLGLSLFMIILDFNMGFGSDQDTPQKDSIRAFTVFCICISVLAFALQRFPVTLTQGNREDIENRFVVEVRSRRRGKAQLLVVPTKSETFNSGLTGKSYVDEGSSERTYSYLTTTYQQYYLKKFGVRLKRPTDNLIMLTRIRRQTNHDLLYSPPSKMSEDTRPVPPELIDILPMPRDLLYMLKEAERFMPVLERHVSLNTIAPEVCKVIASASSNANLMVASDFEFYNQPSVLSLVKAALTVGRYQRLEFLGDAVLSYFLALNIMAQNAALSWDMDDLSQIHQRAGMNTTLFEAALRIGAGNLVNIAWSGTWRSVYGISRPKSFPANELVLEIHNMMDIAVQETAVADKILSDVMESLLAAAFLSDVASNPVEMPFVLGLFESYRLPIANNDAKSYWFKATSPCFHSGYDFRDDLSWQKRILEIGTALYSDREVGARLEEGWRNLKDILQLSALESQYRKILIMCALFDDSLTDNTSLLDHGVRQAAILRDTLCLIGTYSLQLCVTVDIFKNFPSRSEGDLTKLRSCILSNVSITYVMFKNWFHTFLYDQSTPNISRFTSMMDNADFVGKVEWQSRPWPVPEGCTRPKYFGLVAGQLRGAGKTVAKVPDHITDDFNFSFRSIAGALVLSVGLEGMWKAIGPLFEECMLPNRVRFDFSKKSSSSS